MKSVYSEKHALHHPAIELAEGKFIENFEKPERAYYVLDYLQQRKFGDIIKPDNFSLETVMNTHDPRLVEFLQVVNDKWHAFGREGTIFPTIFCAQNFNAKQPKSILGQLGYFIGDGCVPITPTTWEAVQVSAFVALTAQKLIANGEKSAFALCRPPGHHASSRLAAGYCYLNNAAIAAQAFIEQGSKRVAILDVDYHHGNGTQDIFYNRDDVLFLSIHADPAVDYPFFLGYADETGAGKGEGYNFNYPLPHGTGYAVWKAALLDSLNKIKGYKPDALIISLGVDTYKNDPISKFKLESDDFLDMGSHIAGLGLPTMFVMEGGYAIAEVGLNATNVLAGFLNQ
ncbi:MAG: histone deacetylase family protein [Micavibrio sp.]